MRKSAQDAGFQIERLSYWNIMTLVSAIAVRLRDQFLNKTISNAEFPKVPKALNAALIVGLEVETSASQLIVTTFLGGINLLGIGVVREYVARIYDEVKGRPNYMRWFSTTDKLELAGFPLLDDNFQTTTPRVYVARTLCAGHNANVVFVENSREHGPRIVNHIRSTTPKKVAT